MKWLLRHRVLAIFLAGGIWGVFGVLMSLPRTETPHGRALKAGYLANQLDKRPTVLSPLTGRAAEIWDVKNAEGFEWGQRMALTDPKYCPGTHGPFYVGCVEAAKGRAIAMGGIPRLN